MKTTSLLCGLVMVVGCSKSDKDGASDKPAPAGKAVSAESGKPAKPAEPPPPAIPPMPKLAGLFACHSTGTIPPPGELPFKLTPCASIPSVFGAVTFGMAKADVDKATHARFEDGYEGGFTAYKYLPAHGWRRQLAWDISKDDHLESLSFTILAPELDTLKAAWGEPLVIPDVIGQKLVWFDPATKLKITATESKQDKGDVEVPGYSVHLVPYLPIAELFSKTGVLATPLLGKKLEEVAAAFPTQLKVKTKAESAAELKALTNDQKLVDFAAGDDVSITLPPTETDNSTSLRLDWDKTKVVTGFSVGVMFDKTPGAHDEILAQLAESFGPPTGVKMLGSEQLLLFAGPNNTVIEANYEDIGGMWMLSARAK